MKALLYARDAAERYQTLFVVYRVLPCNLLRLWAYYPTKELDHRSKNMMLNATVAGRLIRPGRVSAEAAPFAGKVRVRLDDRDHPEWWMELLLTRDDLEGMLAGLDSPCSCDEPSCPKCGGLP